MLVGLLHNPKLRVWIETNTRAQSAEREFRRYFVVYLNKIDIFQEMMLKIADFKNLHIFREDEVRFLRSGRGGTIAPKLYHKYFNFIRKRLKTSYDLSRREFRPLRANMDSVHYVQQHLHDLVMGEPELAETMDVALFDRTFRALEALLRAQIDHLTRTRQFFKRFVGHEESWIQTYRFDDDSRRRHIAEWRTFLELLETYKSQLKREAMILLNIDLPPGVSTWKVHLRNKIRSCEILREMHRFVEVTETVKALSQAKKITVYHATEAGSNPFPLSEARFGAGFFVCTDDKKYALRIKRDQSMGDPSRVGVMAIRLPLRTFAALFQEDPNHGRFGDPESERAYEHAFFLPVSGYVQMNHLFNEGLIDLQ